MSEYKILKNTLECKNQLFKLVNKYNNDEEVRKYMQQIYIDKNMGRRRVNDILKNKTPIDILEQYELVIWCYYLEQLRKEIKADDYFTPNEIEGAINYYKPDEVEHDPNKMVFYNVVECNGQYLIPYVSNYDIERFFVNSLVGWNSDTQRDPKLSVEDGQLVRRPNINWNSVEDIEEEIYSNEFTANLITFNILNKNRPIPKRCLEYNEQTKVLIITPYVDEENNIEVSITDGLHRSMGNNKAVERSRKENKTLTGGFMLSITNFTVRDAQKFIRREDKRNPLSHEYSKSLEKDEYNIFIERLNLFGSESENRMKNKIGNTLEEALMSTSKYTTINILNNALRLTGLTFKEPSDNDEYLEEFVFTFNAILAYYDKRYKEEKVRVDTIVYEPNVFVGYVAIAKEMLHVSRKKKKITDFLDRYLELEKYAYDWANIDMYKQNPRNYKKIYEYFETKIKEFLLEVEDDE